MNDVAHVLVVLELGGKLGHLARVRPVVEGLRSAGARVTVWCRDVEAARLQLGGAVERWPHEPPTRVVRAGWVGHLGDTLAALGWTEADYLERRVRSWREGMVAGGFSAVLADASPTALLAADGVVPTVVHLTDGYGLPPAGQRLRDMGVEGRLREARPTRELQDDVLGSVNRVRLALGASELGGVSDVFHLASRVVLATLPEFDPHGGQRDAQERKRIEYVGNWGSLRDASGADWPSGGEPRVLAYLRSFPSAPALVQMLQASGLSTLGFGSAFDEADKAGVPGLRVSATPIDLARLDKTPGLAIGHGGAGFTASCAMAGVPMFVIPLTLEQTLRAQRVEAAGLGIAISADRPQSMAVALQRLLLEPAWADVARSFADMNGDVNPRVCCEGVVQTLAMGV